MKELDVHLYWEAKEPILPNEYPEGTRVNETYHSKTSITKYAHELRINKEKRKIRLIRPEYLGEILKMKRDILSNNFSREKGRRNGIR